MLNLRINNKIEIKSAWEWIRSAFYIFREQPVEFIALSILLVLFGLIPLAGLFVVPLFIGQFARIIAKIESGYKIQFSSLFQDFFANITLLRLAFINFSLNTILLIAKYLLDSYLADNAQYIHIGHTMFGLAILLVQVFIGVSMWLSPIICINYPEIRPVEAMKLSIKAGLYNVIPLLAYSVIVVAFTIIAILPVGLGLFIWTPVFNISTYFIYKTIIH